MLKMDILPTIIGNYNDSKLHIMVDKVCGNNFTSLTFVKDKNFGYCPSFALKDDIRNLVKQFHLILALYQKEIDDEKYTQRDII